MKNLPGFILFVAIASVASVLAACMGRSPQVGAKPAAPPVPESEKTAPATRLLRMVRWNRRFFADSNPATLGLHKDPAMVLLE